jgi:hypothetical protein
MISPEEFASYRSLQIAAKSKYGTVYHVYQRLKDGYKTDFFVFEKMVNGEKTGFFKMDEMTRVENDSTFRFCSPPLKSVADTDDWPKGLWFYCHRKGPETDYSPDSLPPKLTAINTDSLATGIYHFEHQKLVKISAQQSETIFDSLGKEGFFYLPNPGRFFMTVKFSQIE